MRKGQAFDAFKLLIAAVVAGVILVIILSMLDDFLIPGQNPMEVMGQQITKVSSGGLSMVSEATVKFGKGASYEADAVAKAGGLNLGSLIFCCDDGDAEKCAGYAFPKEQFSCANNELTVEAEMSGNVYTYCPTDPQGKCLVGFSAAR